MASVPFSPPRGDCGVGERMSVSEFVVSILLSNAVAFYVYATCAPDWRRL